MVLSLVVWYIVGGHIGVVIMFLYVANCFEVDFKAIISAKKTMKLKSIQSSVKLLVGELNFDYDIRSDVAGFASGRLSIKGKNS
jgi:hypothetical protein